MSYLIFCSFEVGGFPFRMAKTLNRFGVETYYIYLGNIRSGHDSTQFHHGNRFEKWDFSNLFQDILGNPKKIIERLSQIKKLHKISHCLATGMAAYYLIKAGINYKYWSYGADIDDQYFIRVDMKKNQISWRPIKNPYRMWNERRKTRNSIIRADSVMISPYQQEAFTKICINKKMFFLPHFFKIIDYQVLLQQKAQNKRTVCEEIRAERYFFSSTRHVWAGPLRNLIDNKGNNIMLNSYAIFKKITVDDHSKLVLVKKGPDVELSKSLSRSLGIEDDVVWIDEMKREELDRYYQGAAICFGQFGTPVVTYAALEPLANGTISISFLNDNNSPVPFYKEKPPIFSNINPKEIAEFMVKKLAEEKDYEDLSYNSWLWIQNNCSEEIFVKSFLTLFQEA